MLIAGMMGGIELAKYDGIDFTPPEGAREAAKRALDVRDKKPASQRGMTAVGIARARDLINGLKFSPDTVRRMKAFFDRHEVDKKGETWDEQGKGWQAWNGWGGDAGYAWARKVVRQMEARDKNLSDPQEPTELADVGELNPCGMKDDGTFDDENTRATGYGRPKKVGGYTPKRPGGKIPKQAPKPQPPATATKTKPSPKPEPTKVAPKIIKPKAGAEKEFPPYKKWDRNEPNDMAELAKIEKKLLSEPLENREPLPNQPHRIPLVEQFEEKSRNRKTERALITDLDGNVILTKNGTKRSVSFTNQELEMLKGKEVLLTHNHPNDSGLSPADYIFASKNNVAEFRAVGATKTFTIKRPKDGWPTDSIRFNYDVQQSYRETKEIYSKLYLDNKITFEQYRDNWANKSMELIKLKTGVEYEYRRKT